MRKSYQFAMDDERYGYKPMKFFSLVTTQLEKEENIDKPKLTTRMCLNEAHFLHYFLLATVQLFTQTRSTIPYTLKIVVQYPFLFVND